ncbi:MAG TPA: hypothetical protein PKO09_17910 [Anaerolineae bacterium]|nr:hypothetical protein [Anaerolineae bacterium]
MAKKSRRARTALPSSSVAGAVVSPVVQPVRVVRTPTAQAAKEVDFRHEYYYVLKDLKTTFIIAGVLLVVMVALALVIA